ncbi:hypothetical protein BD770DRAFT_474515 [Pilaira anomala]|nr:hypothetical protein BD770DRAFT_474515 [Pilaira anomala]
MSYFIPSPAETTYSSAFPPLQSIPWSFNHKVNPMHHSMNPIITPLAPPKYPTYLKHTSYADLVTEQYDDSKRRRNATTTTATATKEVEELDLRLPQFWHKSIKSSQLEIGSNGYDLTYITGPGKKDCAHATTVHTNFPIRPQCGVYYFEVSVLRKGQDGHFGIGFARLHTKLDKLPGCDKYSWGYHGETGQRYGQGQSSGYGPSYASGDTIGCCINFAQRTAFFTKNGVSLGTAFEKLDISQLFYPAVGLSTDGEQMTANFGQKEFLYDIDLYIKTQKAKSIQSIQQQKTIRDSDLDQLVLSYLIHQGYTQTAKSLLKNIQYVKKEQEERLALEKEAEDRNKIRKLVLNGSIDLAIEQTNVLYPGLLETNPELLFQLKQRKFLDILLTENHHHGCSTSSIYTSSDDTDDDTSSMYSSGRSRAVSIGSEFKVVLEEGEEEEDHDVIVIEKIIPVIKSTTTGYFHTPPLPVAASGRRLSWAAIAASPTTTPDPLEEVFMTTTTTTTTTQNRRKSMSCRTRRDSSCSFESIPEEKMSMIRKAMQYGHQLQDEYQTQSKFLHQLKELFTLLTSDLKSCFSLAHLLVPSHRDTVASELNTAIQFYQGKSKESNLELVFKQCMLINRELSISGHGEASLIQDDYVSV